MNIRPLMDFVTILSNEVVYRAGITALKAGKHIVLIRISAVLKISI